MSDKTYTLNEAVSIVLKRLSKRESITIIGAKEYSKLNNWRKRLGSNEITHEKKLEILAYHGFNKINEEVFKNNNDV